MNTEIHYEKDDSHLAVVESRRAVKRHPGRTYSEMSKGIKRIDSSKVAVGTRIERTTESELSEC